MWSPLTGTLHVIALSQKKQLPKCCADLVDRGICQLQACRSFCNFAFSLPPVVCRKIMAENATALFSNKPAPLQQGRRKATFRLSMRRFAHSTPHASPTTDEQSASEPDRRLVRFASSISDLVKRIRDAHPDIAPRDPWKERHVGSTLNLKQSRAHAKHRALRPTLRPRPSPLTTETASAAIKTVSELSDILDGLHAWADAKESTVQPSPEFRDRFAERLVDLKLRPEALLRQWDANGIITTVDRAQTSIAIPRTSQLSITFASHARLPRAQATASCRRSSFALRSDSWDSLPSRSQSLRLTRHAAHQSNLAFPAAPSAIIAP